MGRRITRKQLKKDDEFVSAAEVIFRWIADNAKALIVGTCRSGSRRAAVVGGERLDEFTDRRRVVAFAPRDEDLRG